MDLGLAGKVAVVTGGSSGIGLGVAQALAAEGADVLICARREPVLAAAAQKIKQATGKTVATASIDVTSPQAIDRLRDIVAERYGRIDVLINNAGTGTYKPFLEVTDDELVDGMALNFFAQFRVTQRFVPMMQRARSGSIVNISGCSGLMVLDPPFLSTCTGPAKAAEIRFTKALAAEVGAFGIRVNCIAPHFVVAPERFERWRRTMGADPAATAEDIQQQWGARIALPGKRWCTIEEVTKAILFVASPAASYMTGSVMVIDGGYGRS
jgi:NAD(P)-dependent dehydrogenase (short-subunit alcohol dehydrogenase family)